MNMTKQKKYLINGIILLLLGVAANSIVPVIVQEFGYYNVSKSLYGQIEFFLFTACALYFMFSPKYYRIQVLCIFIALCLYLLFRATYSFIF